MHPDHERYAKACEYPGTLNKERDQLVQALDNARTQLAATGCPLCTYVNGVPTKQCALHLQVGELTKERDELEALIDDARKAWEEERQRLNRLNDEVRRIVELWGGDKMKAYDAINKIQSLMIKRSGPVPKCGGCGDPVNDCCCEKD